MKVESLNQEGGYLVPAYMERPMNKWQAFKGRHFPYWLKRMFPVKTIKFAMADYLRGLLD